MPDSQLGSSFEEYRNLILDALRRLEANAEKQRERSDASQESIKQTVVEVKIQLAQDIASLRQALSSEVEGQLKELDERIRPLEMRLSNIYATASGLGLAGGVIIWLAQLLISKLAGVGP